MPLDIARLFGSEFHARANDAEWSTQESVTAYLKQPDGVFRATQNCTTEETYNALTTGDQIPVGEPAWQLALAAIVKALTDPKPEHIEASRGALHRLA
jgi:hypothetical protein